MRKPTTLVLGAGASIDYGFPVGTDLRRKILALGDEHLAEVCGPTHFANSARMFLQEFKQSQRYSIDAFLARRGEFTEIGKVAIAEVLLSCENQSEALLFGDPEGGHWYRRLVNALAGHDWDDFDPGWLSIVTFNYDRSLEWFLLRALMAIYGKAEADVVERLQRLRIIHVYGSLGSPWPAADYLPYTIARRERLDRHKVSRAAAERLVVIPEGRDDDPQLEPARAVLRAAAVVAFMGFGFDADNVRRLGAPQIFARGAHCVPILATTRGLEDAEVGNARRRLLRGLKGGTPERPLDHDFHAHSVDCDMLLRRTGLLV